MRTPITARACGTCSMCCKVLEIKEEELVKPEGEWCKHCRPGNGCSIYEMRPPLCRSFKCMWLDNTLTDLWQPIKSKMVVSWCGEQGNGERYLGITVDNDSPLRWREEPFYSDIRRIAAAGLSSPRETWWPTRVRCNCRTWVILPDEEVEITGGTFTMYQTKFKKWRVEVQS